MGLAEVRADARVLAERLQALPESEAINVKQILCDDVLPLFDGLVESIQEGIEADVADLEDAVDELMDASSDVLHPETAAKLIGTLEFGKQIALELEALLKKQKTDDLSKKRISGLIQMFRQGAEISLGIIQEITIPLDEATPPETEDEPDPDEGEEEDPDADPDDEDDVAADGGEG
jgi:hypothetical protein